MTEGRKTEEDYFNLLGMFGTVLHHVGGKVEVPYSELELVDLTAKELTTRFDGHKNVFVFELKDIINA